MIMLENPKDSAFAFLLAQQTELLTAAQEQELARRVQNDNDQGARSKLVTSNLRLVVNIARGFLGKGLSLDELITEGSFGLLKAVDKYQPDIGRFSTYATPWIKQPIRRALKQESIVGVPEYLMGEVFAYKRFCKKQHLEENDDTLGFYVTVCQRRKTEAGRKRLACNIKNALKTESIDVPTSVLVYPLENADFELQEVVDQYISRLSEPTQSIVQLRLQGTIFQEIKKRLDLTMSRDTIALVYNTQIELLAKHLEQVGYVRPTRRG